MKKVIVFDSGSGGVNVLAECVKLCPCCDFIVVADEKSSPYGDKTKHELEKIAYNLVGQVLPLKPDIIVFACNTLTATTINKVRKKYPNITFIGSEPAIKPALANFKREEILILATRTTIRNCCVLRGYKDISMSPKNLPKLIDSNLENLDLLTPYIKKEIFTHLGSRVKDIKGIVLGCTHFEGIKKQLKEIFPDVKLFGSAEGIAHRLREFCSEDNSFQVQFMTTANSENFGKYYYYFNSISKF